jgi:hypothetical protein
MTQLRSEEWQGTRQVVGNHAMPAPTQTRAGDARYDSPPRGALPHTEGSPVAALRTADDEIIRGGGLTGRPEHGVCVVPGPATSFRIPGHFRAVSLERILLYPRPAPDTESRRQRVGDPARLAGAGNLSPAFPPGGRTRACDEGGQ